MLTIYKPNCVDLWFKQLMMADEATMSYNHAYGGTIPFPKENWQGWYEKWVAESADKRFYRYLKNDAGDFVGELSYRFDADKNIYLADVVILAKYRGNGYGGEALNMLCTIARDNGIEELYDEIAIDNAQAISLFKKQGFKEIARTNETVMLKKEL